MAPRLVARISSYTVDDSPKGQLGSDHLPIIMQTTFSLPPIVKREKSRYYRLDLSKLDSTQTLRFRNNVEVHTSRLFRRIQSHPRSDLRDPSLLNRYFEILVGLIHRFYWRSRKRGGKSAQDFGAVPLDEFLSSDFQIPPSAMVEPEDRLDLICEQLRTARFCKLQLQGLRGDALLSKPSLILLQERMEWTIPVEGLTANQAGRRLRQRIEDLTSQFNQESKRRGLSTTDYQDEVFVKSRKEFYKRFVKEDITPFVSVSQIYDSQLKRVVGDKFRVHQALIREGKSLLCDPVPMPEGDKRPEWFDTMYSRRSRIKGVESEGFS